MSCSLGEWNMFSWVLWIAAWAEEPPWATIDAPGWSEVATRETDLGTVKVEHRKVGAVDCLQGTTTTTTPLEKVHAVATDIPNAPKWSHVKLWMSETLATTDDGFDYVQMLDVPNWTLVADRFWVLHGTTLRSGDGTVRFRWRRVDAEARYPEVAARARTFHSGAIEPPVNYGEWILRPGAGAATVTYRACSDVGGSLPSSIQKWVAQRTLPDTVADVLRAAKAR